MDILSGIVDGVSRFVGHWVELTLEAGIVADPVLVLLIVLFVTVWLGSGAWSSSIAETRGYGSKLHFFVGIFVPIVYPAVLLVMMGIKPPPKRKPSDATKMPSGEKAGKKDKAKTSVREKSEAEIGVGTPEETEQMPSEESIPPKAPPNPRDDMKPRPLSPKRAANDETSLSHGEDGATGEEALPYGQRFFRDLADTCKRGAVGAGWRVVYGGGREIVVRDVSEAAAKYTVVTIINDEGENQRIRIPYARVESVEPADAG